MRLLAVILLIFVLAICCIAYAQELKPIWYKTWGGGYYDHGKGVKYFNGYVYVAGWTSSFGIGDDDVLLLKYDDKGNLIWARTWGTEGKEWGFDIDVDENGIYVAVGSYLLKFSHDGELIWLKRFEIFYPRSVEVVDNIIYASGWFGIVKFVDKGGDVELVMPMILNIIMWMYLMLKVIQYM